ncbi:MAG: molybdenum cofactor biosynthesis protein MoeB, partial [Armatimonadetes bacterium CG_4_9_14_3_um_filter_58_7]
IVIDGTDNFPTRYLVNDACVLLGKPNVYGSIFRFEGQASVFDATRGPCYRCLYNEPPPPGLVPSCAEGGVLGILPGIIGLIQATEAIKLIIGKGTPLIGRFLRFDALEMKFQELKLRKDPNCPICGENPTIKELIDYNEFCGIQPTPEVEEDTAVEITPEDLKDRLDRGEVLLVDVREPHEWDICHIEGARLIPLSEFTQRLHELDSASNIVLYCHKGQRSLRALRFLEKAGFRKLWNLKGGINEWALSVNPDLPRY